MKQPLPPSIQLHLAEVERIADGLAATSCDFPASAFAGMNIAAVLSNLDDVASAVSPGELTNAPAMLNSAARAFRHAFRSDSLGWEDAGRLQTIASDLAAYLAEVAVVEAEALHGWQSIQACDARSAYQAHRPRKA